MIAKHRYKYQAFTTQALANLTNRQIWFSKPSRFNDPFDCALKVWSSNLSDAELTHLYLRYKAKLSGPNDWDERYLTNGQLDEQFKEYIARDLEGAFSDRLGILRQRGVACFS